MKNVMLLTGAGQIVMAIARRMGYSTKIVIGDIGYQFYMKYNVGLRLSKRSARYCATWFKSSTQETKAAESAGPQTRN